MKTPILSSSIKAAGSLALAGCLAWSATPAVQAGGGIRCAAPTFARAVVSEDQVASGQAIATLRSFGQQGLDAIFAAHESEIGALREARARRQPLSPTQQRLRAAIDAVSQQHDGFTSQLFWHTDLEAAKAAAKVTGKPILSLRLLGKLTDEYSCANSRFFRTILYANTEVSKQLRENYVLHWESVRPVPKVRIDFGDGRTLERTLTGNSIHYVLSTDGSVIDALPGLYGPGAFLEGLKAATAAEQSVRRLVGDEHFRALQRYHTVRLAGILERWEADLKSTGATAEQAQSAPAGDAVGALQMKRAALAAATPEEAWTRFAALRSGKARLDDASRALIAAQHPTAEVASRITVGKSRVEDPLLQAIRSTEYTTAVDTVRNEYLLHTQLHGWLAQANGTLPLPQLNERVYAELFLTPSSDPWLGLAPAGAYSALEGDGRTEPLLGQAKQP